MMKRLKGIKKILPFVFVAVGLFILIFIYQAKEIKILFVGDMFFDRHIRRAVYTNGEDFVFSCIGDFLKEADLVVGNLEGPVTENASVSLLSQVGAPDNFTFTFPTNVPKLLAKNNIKVVSLGNNHIGNFGKEGILSTRKFLAEAGVEYFGGLSGDEPIHQTKIKGQKISFIAYNEFGGESKEKVAEKIKSEKEKGQTVIVYTHWGEEYVEANANQKSKAKLFAESGADFIVGAHPHVIQESEILKIKDGEKNREVPVYYSLGNFIFDQYWNKEVSTGLILEVKIGGADIEITEHKVSINRDGRTCLMK